MQQEIIISMGILCNPDSSPHRSTQHDIDAFDGCDVIAAPVANSMRIPVMFADLRNIARRCQRGRSSLDTSYQDEATGKKRHSSSLHTNKISPTRFLRARRGRAETLHIQNLCTYCAWPCGEAVVPQESGKRRFHASSYSVHCTQSARSEAKK